VNETINKVFYRWLTNICNSDRQKQKSAVTLAASDMNVSAAFKFYKIETPMIYGAPSVEVLFKIQIWDKLKIIKNAEKKRTS
jgi:hypothetical protein